VKKDVVVYCVSCDDIWWCRSHGEQKKPIHLYLSIVCRKTPSITAYMYRAPACMLYRQVPFVVSFHNALLAFCCWLSLWKKLVVYGLLAFTVEAFNGWYICLLSDNATAWLCPSRYTANQKYRNVTLNAFCVIACSSVRMTGLVLAALVLAVVLECDVKRLYGP